MRRRDADIRRRRAAVLGVLLAGLDALRRARDGLRRAPSAGRRLPPRRLGSTGDPDDLVLHRCVCAAAIGFWAALACRRPVLLEARRPSTVTATARRASERPTSERQPIGRRHDVLSRSMTRADAHRSASRRPSTSGQQDVQNGAADFRRRRHLRPALQPLGRRLRPREITKLETSDRSPSPTPSPAPPRAPSRPPRCGRPSS